jgi:hypothetical protein
MTPEEARDILITLYNQHCKATNQEPAAILVGSELFDLYDELLVSAERVGGIKANGNTRAFKATTIARDGDGLSARVVSHADVLAGRVDLESMGIKPE